MVANTPAAVVNWFCRGRALDGQVISAELPDTPVKNGKRGLLKKSTDQEIQGIPELQRNWSQSLVRGIDARASGRLHGDSTSFLFTCKRARDFIDPNQLSIQ